VNRGLPAKYLVKHFTRQYMQWEISFSIRACGFRGKPISIPG
jgi:hypothetical protein